MATEQKLNKVKKPFYKKWWVWLIAIIVIISIANSGGGSDTTPTDSTSTDTTKPLVDEAKDARDTLAKTQEADKVIKEGETLVKEDVNGDGVIGEAKAEVKPEPAKKEAAPAPTYKNVVADLDEGTVISEIKKQAKSDFPDDYVTQDYVVETQTGDYHALRDLEITSDTEETQLKQAYADFPYDFTTAKYVYEEQMKAYNN